MQGYVKVFRALMDHWIWKDANKLKWWLDIIFLCNIKENKMLKGTTLVTIERGSFHTSINNLSLRWEIDKRKVGRFLKMLENDCMIETDRSRYGITIKVVKYEEYQGEYAGEVKKPKEPKTEEKPKKAEDNRVTEIIEYLNSVCGTAYKPTTSKTVTLIKTRLKEKFEVEDFKKVVDIKFFEWGKDDKMKNYLRPETLFGTKFESYLNQNKGFNYNTIFDEQESEYSELYKNL